MKRAYQVFITFGVLVFLIAGLYFFSNWFSRVTGYFAGESEEMRLAQCLTGKEIKVYGAELSPDWNRQKEIFGSSFKKLNYEICNKTGDICAGLKQVPAWYINGSVYYGIKSLDELRVISGCVDE